MIRQSVIAGSWYPGNPDQLRELIGSYWNSAEELSIKSNIRGMLCPHAGYPYSGVTAAKAYKLLLGRNYETVVIISPMHQWPPSPWVMNDSEYYYTPLGKVKVDQSLKSKLASRISMDFIPIENEHAIEIQLPFLQEALKSFKILPIMAGTSNVHAAEEMADVLEEILDAEKTLIIASSDLHHLDDYTLVLQLDREVISTLRKMDIALLRDRLAVKGCTVCGKVPILVMIDLCKRWKADKLHIINQTNSGDVTGMKGKAYTVGYVSAVVTE